MSEKLFRTAQFLGLDCTGETGSERICTCPFCNRAAHFNWNIEKSLGHCWVCDAKVNAMGLLSKLMQDLDNRLDLRCLESLAQSRRLPVEAFKEYGIVYLNSRYILPVFDISGRLASLRSYRLGETIMNLGGCPASLFSAQRLGDQARSGEPVYICEGEWDAIALEWLRIKARKSGVVVGAPGAMIFKPIWVRWFIGRQVFIAYDNDEPGKTGSQRVAKLLSGVAKDIYSIKWKAGTPQKFDVRDLITNNLSLF